MYSRIVSACPLSRPVRSQGRCVLLAVDRVGSSFLHGGEDFTNRHSCKHAHNTISRIIAGFSIQAAAQESRIGDTQQPDVVRRRGDGNMPGGVGSPQRQRLAPLSCK